MHLDLLSIPQSGGKNVIIVLSNADRRHMRQEVMRSGVCRCIKPAVSKYIVVCESKSSMR